MSKITELIYDVREGLKAFSDDSELDDRYIMYLYNIKRAKYLRQDLNNFQRTTDLSVQQTFCLELEEVSSNECGVDLTCDKIMRSKQPIPKAIELHSKPAITSIRPTDKLSIPFSFIDRIRAPHLANSPFGQAIYAFIDNDYHAYVISKGDDYKLINCITVSGVFENPLELKDYKNCCGCNIEDAQCFNEDETEYPLQPHYVDIVRGEIIQELGRTKFLPEDKDNDATDGATKERQK